MTDKRLDLLEEVFAIVETKAVNTAKEFKYFERLAGGNWRKIWSEIQKLKDRVEDVETQLEELKEEAKSKRKFTQDELEEACGSFHAKMLKLVDPILEEKLKKEQEKKFAEYSERSCCAWPLVRMSGTNKHCCEGVRAHVESLKLQYPHLNWP